MRALRAVAQDVSRIDNIPDIGRTAVIALIDEWVIGRNAERNREITKMRLIQGIKFEQIAELFDLSARQVKNIVYRCEKKIFSHYPG